MIRNVVNKVKNQIYKPYYLVSYPKSGNTWLRFLLGNYLSDSKINFSNYHEVIPDIHRNPHDLKKVTVFPLIIKSHFDFRSEYKNIIYVVRDGRDVAVSYYYHVLGKGRIPESMSFKDYLYGYFLAGKDIYGDWGDHINSWLFNNNFSGRRLIIKYEDLLKNPEMEMEQVINFLKIDLNRLKIKNAVKNSSMQQMKDSEDKYRKISLEHKDVKNDKFSFVRKGKKGDWKNYFDENMAEDFREKYDSILNYFEYTD